MGQNSSHYLSSIAAFQTAYQTVLLPLSWNLTKTLKQLGASHHFCPRDASKWFPFTMTLSLTDGGPCRTQHFPYLHELEQWLGEVNRAVNVSYQMAPLFITLVVITTETPYWALAKLSPAKTEVTLMIPEQMLNLFLLWDTSHLLISTASGSCWRSCLLKWLQVKVALHSFTRTLVAMGQGWEPDRPPCKATATYFLSLRMQWHTDMSRVTRKLSSHLSIPCHPICSHIQSKWMMFISQMLAPCATYWESYAYSAVSKTWGKDIEN